MNNWPSNCLKDVQIHAVLDKPPFDFKELTLVQAAASKAFWNLTIVSVKPFAEQRGVDLGANSSLCDVLFDIIKKEFKCTDAQAMQLVSQRLGVNDLP